ncbi:MAG: hypothetical protein ACOC1P_03665, partial [Minisyncoccales bacterium]
LESKIELIKIRIKALFYEQIETRNDIAKHNKPRILNSVAKLVENPLRLKEYLSKDSSLDFPKNPKNSIKKIKEIVQKKNQKELIKLLSNLINLSYKDLKIAQKLYEEEIFIELEKAANMIDRNQFNEDVKSQIDTFITRASNILKFILRSDKAEEFFNNPDNFNFEQFNFNNFGEIHKQIILDIINKIDKDYALEIIKKLKDSKHFE